MYGYFFGMSMLWWLFWIIVIAAFFSLLAPVPRSRIRATRETPLEILQRRYAAGEIDTAEYEERRRRLVGEHPTSEAAKPAISQPLATHPAGPENGEHVRH